MELQYGFCVAEMRHFLVEKTDKKERKVDLNSLSQLFSNKMVLPVGIANLIKTHSKINILSHN